MNYCKLCLMHTTKSCKQFPILNKYLHVVFFICSLQLLALFKFAALGNNLCCLVVLTTHTQSDTQLQYTHHIVARCVGCCFFCLEYFISHIHHRDEPQSHILQQKQEIQIHFEIKFSLDSFMLICDILKD